MSGIVLRQIWLILPLFFLACNSPERRLNRKWPEKRSLLSTEAVSEGLIHFSSGDTLGGYLKIHADYISDSIPLLPFNKSKQSEIVQIQTSTIDYISLRFPDKAKWVDYMPVAFRPSKPGHRKKPRSGGFWLFEILGKKNDLRLIYREWGTTDGDGNASYYGQLGLASGKELLNFLSNRLPALKSNATFLLAFINKRYNQHFTKAELDVKARVAFILDRE